MSDEDDEEQEELDPIITRGVHISEVMSADGQLRLVISNVGSPAPWDQLGMIEAAKLSVQTDLQEQWVVYDDSEDESE